MLLGFDLCVAGAILTPVQRSLQLCYPCPGNYTDADLAACSCASKELAISAVSIGATFGALLGGLVADLFGRRLALLASDVLFGAGGVAMACATPQMAWAFFSGRAAVGLGLGLGGSAASAFLAEIAPSAWRGRFLEFNECAVCVGCLGAYALAFALGDSLWRVSIGLTVVVALVQFVLILAVLHESPSWLASHGRVRHASRARRALSSASSSSSSSTTTTTTTASSSSSSCAANSDAADDELATPAQEQSLSATLRALRRARRPLLLALGVATAHALTAANTVLYYSRDVLALAGIRDALLASTTVGVAKVVGVAGAFALTDRLGRRVLLLGGTASMIVALGGLAVAFAEAVRPRSTLAFVALLLFILGWDVSWAGLMLTVVAEVLPQPVRGAGTGLAYALYWMLSFLSAQFLETVMHGLGIAHTFGAIAMLCTLVLLWTWRYVPETANRTLEQMERPPPSQDRAPGGEGRGRRPR